MKTQTNLTPKCLLTFFPKYVLTLAGTRRAMISVVKEKRSKHCRVSLDVRRSDGAKHGLNFMFMGRAMTFIESAILAAKDSIHLCK